MLLIKGIEEEKCVMNLLLIQNDSGIAARDVPTFGEGDPRDEDKDEKICQHKGQMKITWNIANAFEGQIPE